MEDSIFTKIIKGEVPCHKVYEDDKTLAFLTISPVLDGHVLVIPKLQVDHFNELPDEDYQAVFTTVKKVANRIKDVFGSKRAIVSVMGFEVPHAHVHVMPADGTLPFLEVSLEHLKHGAPEPDHSKLAEIAKRLAF